LRRPNNNVCRKSSPIFRKRPSRWEGLGGVNRDLVQRVGERAVDQRMATVDQDASIIESRNKEALPT
jgi:hypothetical protein